MIFNKKEVSDKLSNVLVIEGTGTGKDQNYIKPNLLQCSGSYVVMDPGGYQFQFAAKPLEEEGYKIKVLNLSDMRRSDFYNPFKYITDEESVRTFVDALVSPDATEDFADAERLLLLTCVHCMVYLHAAETRKGFKHLIEILNEFAIEESNPEKSDILDKRFGTLPWNTMANQYFWSFNRMPMELQKKAVTSCLLRLRSFMAQGGEYLTNADCMDLDLIGKEKTALFILTPVPDHSNDFLVQILYSQIFKTLHKRDHSSAEPVHFIMNEFAFCPQMSELQSKIKWMGDHGMTASVVVRSVGQLKDIYPDEWRGFMESFDSILFTGTSDPETLHLISSMCGMEWQKLGKMDMEDCVLLRRFHPPVIEKKYRVEYHPLYKRSGDADEKNRVSLRELLGIEMPEHPKMFPLLQCLSQPGKNRLCP